MLCCYIFLICRSGRRPGRGPARGRSGGRCGADAGQTRAAWAPSPRISDTQQYPSPYQPIRTNVNANSWRFSLSKCCTKLCYLDTRGTLPVDPRWIIAHACCVGVLNYIAYIAVRLPGLLIRHVSKDKLKIWRFLLQVDFVVAWNTLCKISMKFNFSEMT